MLDPFIGSGTTGVAAMDLDRYFIGTENNKEYYNVAIKRIKLKNLHLKKQENVK